MSNTAISFIYFITVCLYTSGCALRENFNNKQFQKKFRFEKGLDKKFYSKTDSTLFFHRKKTSTKFSKDTISFYLNKQFLFSKVLNSNDSLTVPLKNSQFGKNILEACNLQNQKFEFKFSVLPDPPQLLQYKILEEHNHDVKAFTQGLIVKGDTIIESTGGYGASTIKKYNYKTGEEYGKADLDKKYFGEGITNFKNKIFLLTYKEKEILIFEENDLEYLDAIPFFSQGWGITHNTHHLIISDGSSSLYFIDPASLQKIKVLKVFDNEGEVKNLNELEYVNGEIYANIWFKDEIVVIDPENGAVTKKIDLKQLVKDQSKGILSENVLNGIAYDENNRNLFITGKRWPLLFIIKILDD